MTFELRITADTVEELSRIVNRISHEPLTIVDASVPKDPDTSVTAEEDPTEVEKACDNNGVPFDPALHSSAKKMNNDGSWKKRRGAAPPPDPDPSEKKAPAPPEDNKPISDFPALMEFLKVDKELSLDQMNELAKQLDLEGIYAAAVVPETFPAIVALANA